MAPRSLVVLRQPLGEEAVREALAAPERVVRREAKRRRRRAGVVVPLFSIRSGSSWGVGEIPDLARFAAWAGKAGLSVVQLLPVNDHSGGIDPSPYTASSAFALDPVYLSLDECEDFRAAGGRDALPGEIKALLAACVEAPLVGWADVRRAKHAAASVAFERFLRDEWRKRTGRARELEDFMKTHRAWLDDYALYIVWHDRFQASWVDWPPEARDRDPGALARLRRDEADALLRVNWTQWQLDRQWRQARRQAARARVEIMGDLPFMVGLDSADVWSHRELFRTDLRVGTPPEDGAPDGQDWGLPVYDWTALGRDRYSWIRDRVTHAGSLFSLYRIDHAMGYYRTYFRSADGRSKGFTPADENEQLQQGEALMRLMGQWGEVVAEDLGIVPGFLRPSLEKLRVPGYRVLRWEKDGDVYRDPGSWPESSVATNATHDTDTTATWYDALSVDERAALKRIPSLDALDPNASFDDRARDAILRAVYAAPSTLTLVMFQDLFGTRERINRPVEADPANWGYRIARSVEELLADTAETERLLRLASETARTR
jgi:4-alpha-glucanotransferase